MTSSMLQNNATNFDFIHSFMVFQLILGPLNEPCFFLDIFFRYSEIICLLNKTYPKDTNGMLVSRWWSERFRVTILEVMTSNVSFTTLKRLPVFHFRFTVQYFRYTLQTEKIRTVFIGAARHPAKFMRECRSLWLINCLLIKQRDN